MTPEPDPVVSDRNRTLRIDEVGYWTEVKLAIVDEYARAYSGLLRKKGFSTAYIDAFAGAGVHVSRQTGQVIEGSPVKALHVDPPFHDFYFVDIDRQRVDNLKRLAGSRTDVHILEGDCNRRLPDDVFPHVRWDHFRRGLCLLDPYGLHLSWRVVHLAGRMESIEMFLNFPMADMNRNVLWHEPQRVAPSQALRMTRFWGDESWREVAYRPQPTLFGTELEKVGNPAIAEAFRTRLQEVAGFKYVPEPIPMRNSQNAIVYYLYFAAQQPVADGIVKDIFDKYRNRANAIA